MQGSAGEHPDVSPGEGWVGHSLPSGHLSPLLLPVPPRGCTWLHGVSSSLMSSSPPILTTRSPSLSDAGCKSRPSTDLQGMSREAGGGDLASGKGLSK